MFNVLVSTARHGGQEAGAGCSLLPCFGTVAFPHRYCDPAAACTDNFFQTEALIVVMPGDVNHKISNWLKWINCLAMDNGLIIYHFF